MFQREFHDLIDFNKWPRSIGIYNKRTRTHLLTLLSWTFQRAWTTSSPHHTHTHRQSPAVAWGPNGPWRCLWSWWVTSDAGCPPGKKIGQSGAGSNDFSAVDEAIWRGPWYTFTKLVMSVSDVMLQSLCRLMSSQWIQIGWDEVVGIYKWRGLEIMHNGKYSCYASTVLGFIFTCYVKHLRCSEKKQTFVEVIRVWRSFAWKKRV